MTLPWKKRNRRQATQGEPGLLERLNWRALAASAAIVAGCVVVAMLLMMALDRPVRRVLVEGAFLRVSPPEIESAVNDVVKGGLASVDLDAVRDRIERIDWVDRAVVQRRWPDALRVVVTEQVAAARWNEAGLLNARGELFIRNARYLPPELPQLEGPEGTEGMVAQLYLDSQGRLLEAGLRLTGVRLDERGAWELELANGVVVKLGRQAVTDRLDRFIRLASSLVAKRLAEINYVDMRYTNGFSVGWNARSAVAVAPQEDATPDA
ncbi:MAG: FtsQ-type POTRA domain-containing protein [Gammaproteobacteria bacterium]|nr:FtsQ-type POTRA domain-containing protein [Gammaproteobacteria bacterium]